MKNENRTGQSKIEQNKKTKLKELKKACSMNSRVSLLMLIHSYVSYVQAVTNNELLLRGRQLPYVTAFFLRTQEEKLTGFLRRERRVFGRPPKLTLIIFSESLGIFCMLWPFCIF